jgi:hypothetical protein
LSKLLSIHPTSLPLISCTLLSAFPSIKKLMGAHVHSFI